MMKTCFLVDASIYIFRYYFSLPDAWNASNGRPTSAVYGFALWLLKLLKNENPSYIAVCFDESLSTCFRNKIYPEYKINRLLPDEDLAFQLLACQELTRLLGVSTFASKKFEADDLIATLCAKKPDYKHFVLTRDKDLGQLVSDKVYLWDYPNGDLVDKDKVKKAHGIVAQYIPDFLAIVGDPIDNVPGVPGIGKKTAAALINHFGDWQNIKSSVDDIAHLPLRGASSVREKIMQFQNQVDMSIRLTRLRRDALNRKVFNLERKPVQRTKLETLLSSLGVYPQTKKYINEL